MLNFPQSTNSGEHHVRIERRREIIVDSGSLAMDGMALPRITAIQNINEGTSFSASQSGF